MLLDWGESDWLEKKNTLAYYAAELISTVKKFNKIASLTGEGDINLILVQIKTSLEIVSDPC